jgi:hypothetical protein
MFSIPCHQQIHIGAFMLGSEEFIEGVLTNEFINEPYFFDRYFKIALWRFLIIKSGCII